MLLQHQDFHGLYPTDGAHRVRERDAHTDHVHAHGQGERYQHAPRGAVEDQCAQHAPARHPVASCTANEDQTTLDGELFNHTTERERESTGAQRRNSPNVTGVSGSSRIMLE